MTPALRARLIAACGYDAGWQSGVIRFCRPRQLLEHKLDKMLDADAAAAGALFASIIRATTQDRTQDATRLRLGLCRWLGVTPGPDLPFPPPTLET
jgi:hypothetical protein